MEITNLTISVEASKNFQKFVYAVTATNISSDAEVKQLEQICIAEACTGINDLCAQLGVSSPEKPTVKTSVPFEPTGIRKQAPKAPAATNPQQTVYVNGAEYCLKYSEKNKSMYYALKDRNLENAGYKKFISLKEAEEQGV